VTRLEQKMGESESSADTLTDLPDALRLVIQIESSELNRIFRGVVKATDSAFVRDVEAFHRATADHLRFISQGVKQLDPKLKPDFEGLLTP
jgi:hypothetical protein